jgi:hypothetical protein
MPARSQRHLREIVGVDSKGDTYFPGRGPANAFTVARNLGARTITVASGPAAYPRTVRVEYKVNGVNNVIPVYATVLIGDTFGAIATKIAAAVNARSELNAAAVGGVVTLTFDTATTIQTLEVSIF